VVRSTIPATRDGGTGTHVRFRDLRPVTGR
jgi:hypothetical protein